MKERERKRDGERASSRMKEKERERETDLEAIKDIKKKRARYKAQAKETDGNEME